MIKRIKLSEEVFQDLRSIFSYASSASELRALLISLGYLEKTIVSEVKEMYNKWYESNSCETDEMIELIHKQHEAILFLEDMK